MRSPEFDTPQNQAVERNPDAVKFETDLANHVNEARAEGVTYAGLKQRIRKFCVDNAKTDEERDLMIQGGYMYFFKYLFGQPEAIENVWKLLYEFQEELNQKDEDETDDIDLTTNMSGLFNENVIGLTPNWRLVHSILKGQLKVSKADFNGEDIYFMCGLDKEETHTKAKSKKRFEISRKFQQDLKEIEEKSQHNQRLLAKPTPGIGRHPAINVHELKVLRKIYLHLQEDADMIYYSATWRNQIDHFFDVVVKGKIEEIIKKLTTGEWRTERYIPFFKEILDTYLAPLKEYCADLTEQNAGPDKVTTNQLPADMMLEPILIDNSYLDKEFKTVPIEFVTAKWDVLWEEIEQLVANQSTGTLFMMEAFKAPEPKDGIAYDETIQTNAFDDPTPVVGTEGEKLRMPRLTGELDDTDLALVNQRAEDEKSLAVLVRDNVRNAVDGVDEWDKQGVWGAEGKPVDINSTAAVTAIQEEEVGRFSGSEPIEHLNEPEQESAINGSFDLRYKASQILNSSTSLYSPHVIEELRRRFEEEILPELNEPELRREFMIILLEKLDKCIEDHQQVDFKALQNLVRDILNRLAISEDVDGDAYIPGDKFVEETKEDIPDLDDNEYADFKKAVEAKGDYQYYINAQRRIEGLMRDLISKLQIHRDLLKKIKGQVYPRELEREYYKELKKTVLEVKNTKKKFKGFWSLKSAGRWISGKSRVNRQAHAYFTQLDDAADKLWEEGCIPTYDNFTYLYFDTQSE